MRLRLGFTLIEMIVFVGIFAVAMAAFMAVFTNVAGVQVRQSAAAEVNSQSQFVLQTVQYYVQRSSLVEAATDVISTALKLRMPSSTEDPVSFNLVGTNLKLTTRSGTAQAVTSTLTSPQVSVSSVSFIKRSHVGAHDAVAVAFTISSVSSAPSMRFSSALQSGASRVSAATFDSSVVPNSVGTLDLGAAAGDWRSINDTIFFSGHNVAIGDNQFSPSAGARLHVRGNVKVESNNLYAEFNDYAGAMLLRSPSGACWQLMVSKTGDLTAEEVSCPGA